MTELLQAETNVPDIITKVFFIVISGKFEMQHLWAIFGDMRVGELIAFNIGAGCVCTQSYRQHQQGIPVLARCLAELDSMPDVLSRSPLEVALYASLPCTSCCRTIVML